MTDDAPKHILDCDLDFGVDDFAEVRVKVAYTEPDCLEILAVKRLELVKVGNRWEYAESEPEPDLLAAVMAASEDSDSDFRAEILKRARSQVEWITD